MVDDKVLRSYRLNDEQLRDFRDLMIENVESTRIMGSIQKMARVENLVLIELLSRELDRRAFGGFYAPEIDEEAE